MQRCHGNNNRHDIYNNYERLAQLLSTAVITEGELFIDNEPNRSGDCIHLNPFSVN